MCTFKRRCQVESLPAYKHMFVLPPFNLRFFGSPDLLPQMSIDSILVSSPLHALSPHFIPVCEYRIKYVMVCPVYHPIIVVLGGRFVRVTNVRKIGVFWVCVLSKGEG